MTSVAGRYSDQLSAKQLEEIQAALVKARVNAFIQAIAANPAAASLSAAAAATGLGGTDLAPLESVVLAGLAAANQTNTTLPAGG
jgi:hypothetical protein